MSSIRSGAAAAAALLLVACGGADPELRPAATAGVSWIDAEVGRASQAGVTVSANPGLASGRAVPGEFLYTPTTVRIENNSGAPLLVRYEQFRLATADGETFEAIPVYALVRDPIATDPLFEYDGFAVAPVYEAWFPGIGVWARPWPATTLAYGAYDYQPFMEVYQDRRLLAEALPEGVIQDGGSLRGVVWFEDLSEEVDRVTFQAELVNADTGAEMGRITIPFVNVRDEAE